MPQVIFTINADGKDVTSSIKPVLMSMTITDGEGLEADTLNLVIDDVEGGIEPPRTGAVLNPIGGYEGRLRDFGQFSVDDVRYVGWPQTITISAQSVAAKKLAKQKEPKSYTETEFPTYGDVFNAVGTNVDHPVSISASLAGKPNPGEWQGEESSMEFLTRIGEKINASVTVKSGRIVIMEKGSGVSTGGSKLDVIVVTRPGNLLSYEVTEKDEPRYGEVEATTYDRAKNERTAVTASTGLDGPIFRIRAPFQTATEAQEAADAKSKELVRAQADATFTIDGEPFAQAEAFAEVSGVRLRVDGEWKVKTATHNFSGSGPYTTSLQCEVPSP